jgi:hypothetical protein
MSECQCVASLNIHDGTLDESARLAEKCVHHAEDGRIRADAERQGGDSSKGEGGLERSATFDLGMRTSDLARTFSLYRRGDRD